MVGTRTVKVVVIGNSGVGKTSLRGQYISGRFSTGYRATIGADFITKTLPHHSKPDESVTLQIWDTAGQERFSSLSAAFFRGADAALLMYDVNQPETLHALHRWWAEFRDRAPLADEDMEDYCCVVVGNKIDLAEGAGTSAVTEEDALSFIDELVPRSLRPVSPVTPPIHHEILIPISSPTLLASPDGCTARAELTDDVPDGLMPTPTTSIDIGARHHKRPSKSRSRSSQFRFMTGNGTMTTTHTALTSYHTPSSSYFDVFESARSSPIPRSASPSRSRSPSPAPSDAVMDARTLRRMQSMSTLSTSSAPTITPSIFTRHAPAPATPPTPPHDPAFAPLAPRPERRPKLFLTSAKSGISVADVFAYVARRVVMRWEWEEALEARTLHLRKASESTIRLGDGRSMRAETRWGGVGGSCC